MKKYGFLIGVLLLFIGLSAQSETGGAFSYPTLSVQNARLGANGTAVFMGGENVFVNPAFLPYVQDRQLGASYIQLYEFDNVQIFGGYFVQPTRENVCAAVSLTNLKIKGLMRTETEEWGPYTETKAGYHYAQRVGNISVALSGYYLGVSSDLIDMHEKHGEADGLAIDAAAVFEFPIEDAAPYFWGINVQNLYSFLKWRNQNKERLPLAWQTGVSRIFSGYLLSFNIDGDEAAYVRKFGLGASSSFFERILTLSSGTQFDLEESEMLFGVGAGILYHTITVDYSYDFGLGALGGTHRIGVKTVF